MELFYFLVLKSFSQCALNIFSQKWLGFSLFNQLLALFFIISLILVSSLILEKKKKKKKKSIFLLIWFWSQFQRVRRIHKENVQLAREMFNKVCGYLAELSTCEQQWIGVNALKKEILRDYSSLSSSRSESLWNAVVNFAAIDNRSTNNFLFLLCYISFSFCRIKELPRLEFGEQVTTWQWVG